jgi:signal transduction histidine kinase
MIERCQLAAASIAELDVINQSTITDAVRQMGNLNITRMLVTDASGLTIFDSAEDAVGKISILPEVMQALKVNDVFTWHYEDGAMYSRAACPIISFRTVIGCVYIVDYDAEQGALIQSLQNNILTISIVFEILLILFSLFFSKAFSGRLHRIMDSIRTIRHGDYSKKVNVGGNDELTVLGDEFNEMAEKLKAAENQRRQFVSDASHELKTPLSSIKLLSDSILQNEMDIETIREFVSDIGNEADRLNRMSEKLLSLSKIECENNIDCEITYIAPTIEKVARMLSAVAQQRSISIRTEVIEDCPILVLEDDLYEIIFNLSENGIKYNKDGGTLSIRLERNDENAILQITDTGVGIPQEAQAHIFERFYRVDKARSRQSGGSGLGLSIVKDMVERNNGSITVSSQIGIGTTFTLTFPIFEVEVAI